MIYHLNFSFASIDLFCKIFSLYWGKILIFYCFKIFFWRYSVTTSLNTSLSISIAILTKPLLNYLHYYFLYEVCLRSIKPVILQFRKKFSLSGIEPLNYPNNPLICLIEPLLKYLSKNSSVNKLWQFPSLRVLTKLELWLYMSLIPESVAPITRHKGEEYEKLISRLFVLYTFFLL